MDDWVLWLVAAVILGVGEALTTSFFLAPFAGGALVADLVSGAGGGFGIALALALVVSVVLLGRTAAARAVAQADAAADPHRHRGAGRPARCSCSSASPRTAASSSSRASSGRRAPTSTDQTFEPGDRVNVVEIRGATALVTD